MQTIDEHIYHDDKQTACLMYNTTDTTLPPDLCDKKYLNTIIATHNCLTRIDELPSGLIHLNCSHNELVELMPNYNTPQSLTFLGCSNNKLTHLPFDIPEGLEYLDCSHNKLVELPDNLYKCWTLKTLICDNNCLMRLPFLPDDLKTICIIGDREDDPLLKVYPRLAELERKRNVAAIVHYVNRINDEYMYDRGGKSTNSEPSDNIHILLNMLICILNLAIIIIYFTLYL